MGEAPPSRIGSTAVFAADGETIGFADLLLDPQRLKVWRSGRRVPLTIFQFRLLHFLMTHPGRVFTRRELLHQVWSDAALDEGAVTACVVRLRRALTQAGEIDLVRSARGVGYALDNDLLSQPRGRGGKEIKLSHETHFPVTRRS